MTNEELQKVVNGLAIPQLADLKKWADMRLRALKEEHDATARQLNIALGLAPRIRKDKGTKRVPKLTLTQVDPTVRDAFDEDEVAS